MTRGEVIFAEGDTSRDLYLLRRGVASVKLRLPESGRHKRLLTLSAGVMFGEVALLDEQPRSAGVWAEDDSEVYRLAHSDYVELSRENPPLGFKLLDNIARQLALHLRRSSDEVRVLEED